MHFITVGVCYGCMRVCLLVNATRLSLLTISVSHPLSKHLKIPKLYSFSSWCEVI